MSALSKAQVELAGDMRDLAKNLRALAQSSSTLDAVAVVTLGFDVNQLADRVYEIAERHDLTGGGMTAHEIACPEAEAAVLGCLLRSGRPIAALTRIAIEPDDLTDPRYRLVLSGIWHCVERGVDPDPVSVLGELRRLGMLNSFTDDKSAGVLLAELAGAAPVTQSLGHYLTTVIEHRMRRRVLEAAERLTQLAGTASVDALLAAVESEAQHLALHRQRVLQRSLYEPPEDDQ